jgi:hypothetical protein
VHRSPRAGARVLFAATLLMYLVTLVIGFFNLHQDVPDEAGDFLFTALFGLGLLVIGVVGLLVAVRRPGHPIGWVLLVGVALLTLPGLGGEYGVRGLYVQRGLPGASGGAWLTEWLFVPVLFVMPALLLLLFPDGRVATPRWRVAVWMAGGGGVLYLVASVLHPDEVEDTPFKGLPNPLGVEALTSVTAVGLDVAFAALALSVVLGAVSMVVRLRRSRGVARAQLKWVAAAAALFAIACVIGVTTVVVLDSLAGAVVVVLSFPVLPITAGVVILRHRLYDVDVVIRRTLIYGTVTATLVGTYVALVLGLGVVLKPLTGGSDLVVAGSTLVVAGLFGPVRSRVQGVVDRRFYRDRYDANVVLDRFESRLRTDPDLQAVGAELVGAVDETVQPTHLSLWLRDR